MARKRSSILTKMITVFLSIVMIYSLFVMGNYFWNSYQNNKLNNELQDIYNNQENTNQDRHGESQGTFQPFLEINSDVVGWIKLDDTKLDYPVLQAEDNDYYLRQNIHREYALAGSIFMDYRNSRDGSDKNTIIYGHNMKDGSMFNILMEYKKEHFYKEHPFIRFDSLNKNSEWEIFSMYVTDTKFDYIRTNFATDDQYETFLKEIKSRSLYDTGVEVTKEDNILTLSTCSYEFDNARFTVHAKFVN